MKKIIFACGGTLGHINPALSVSKYLKDYDIYFISTTKELKNKTYNRSFIKKVFYFNFTGLNRKNPFKNISIIKTNFKTYKSVKRLLKDMKPDLLISMGGSCGTICSIASTKLKIKTMIHEQNSILGLGNKLVLNKVDKVLLSYPIPNIKGILVGNPVETTYSEQSKTTKEEYILIFGGSNGAKYMNDFFINNHTLFNKYKIILLTGSSYYNSNIELIKKINSPNFNILDKSNNMLDLYNKSKLIISRGGATTLAEIMGLTKVSIIIPSPNVTNNHQYYNALYYKNTGCVDLIEEKDLNENIINNIDYLLTEEIQKKVKQNITNKHNIYSRYHFINEIKKMLGDED